MRNGKYKKEVCCNIASVREVQREFYFFKDHNQFNVTPLKRKLRTRLRITLCVSGVLDPRQ